MDHGFVFQTANAIGPESLDTGYILHNAADILCTNIVLLFAILRYLPGCDLDGLWPLLRYLPERKP